MKIIPKLSIHLLNLLLLVFACGPAAAYYDPGVQRWLNRDGLAEGGGINLFKAVLNNPVSEVDPLGLYADPLGAGNGSTWCPDRCPCKVTCSISGPPTPGKPHHLPGRPYPYFMSVAYPYHCEDCNGKEWDETRSSTKFVAGPGSVIKPASKTITYTIWIPCK
jgi:hypothetical protein